MATSNGAIADKQRILELQNRYSYSIDSGNYDKLDAMFTPDATYHFVTGSTDNMEALKKTIQDALQPLTSSQHINGNQWAEIEGDRATAGCYFTVHMYKEGLADGEHFEIASLPCRSFKVTRLGRPLYGPMNLGSCRPCLSGP